MALEIERKFLISSDAWRAGAHGVLLRQGYLSTNPDCTVRVRLEGEAATLTVKGRRVGPTATEVEVSIPLDDAMALLDLCCQPLIEKRRYRIPSPCGHTWEVDEFLGDNAGLVVAEIELAAEDEAFDRPPWLGEEVTGDRRYANASLAQAPFREWRSAE